jgi:hypothetical protein
LWSNVGPRNGHVSSNHFAGVQFCQMHFYAPVRIFREGGTVKEKITVVGSSMFFYLQEH